MLDTLPQDVLEHIAYHASTHTLLGPPSDLASLLSLSRSTSASLRRSANPHLYASIFAAKFDITAPQRRLALLYGSHPHSVLPVNALAEELVRRFTILKRLRAELGARSSDPNSKIGNRDTIVPDEADSRLDELLWTAFLMVLEDAGRNTAQLRNARIEAWLAVYWFDARGASGAIRRLTSDRWPLTPSYSKDSGGKIRHSLGMWLFWFFLNPAAYVANPDMYRRAERILKLVTLNAPRYQMSHFDWTSFRPEPTRVHFGVPGTSSSEPVDPRALAESRSPQPTSGSPPQFKYFGRELPHLSPLPLAVPASLALLALHTRSRRNADALEGGPGLFELIGPSLAESFIAFSENVSNAGQGEAHSLPDEGINDTIDISSLGTSSRDESIIHADSYRWELDWLRCVYAVSENGSYLGGLVGQSENLAGNRVDTREYKMYQLGSLEGSWEGPFTYTEFHSFATLLAGAKPSKLQDCLIAQHNQTWRLREYHLLAPPSSRSKCPSGSPSQTNGVKEEPIPLPVGDAICAHLPDGVMYDDDSATLHLTLPSSFSPPPSLPSTSSEPLPRTYTYTRCRGYHPSGSRGGANGRAGVEEEDEESYASRVVDILLSGEGHSGWGEFTFLGRVRPVDGLICIMKKYTAGDRGRWLYRGYLVGAGTAHTISPPEFDGEGAGGSKGYIAGRWRDTHTPAETYGYEGAFAMARRR